MKILVLGAAGILGRALMAELAEGHAAVGRDLSDYDIRDLSAFRRDLATVAPEAIINAAAYTKVDEAEGEPDLAAAVNGTAPGKLARAAREAGVRFVQLGSDYIFDGEKRAPYLEGDHPHPLNVYGWSKLLGETEVAAGHPDGHLIIRASWLFGAGGRNFVRTMLERYAAGKREFRVVNDQIGRPTYAPDLARAIRLALEKGARGTYHACNAGATSWFHFAEEIFAAAAVAREVTLEPVTSGEFMAGAHRPSYSVLDTGKLARELGIVLPDYRDALGRHLPREA